MISFDLSDNPILVNKRQITRVVAYNDGLFTLLFVQLQELINGKRKPMTSEYWQITDQQTITDDLLTHVANYGKKWQKLPTMTATLDRTWEYQQ